MKDVMSIYRLYVYSTFRVFHNCFNIILFFRKKLMAVVRLISRKHCVVASFKTKYYAIQLYISDYINYSYRYINLSVHLYLEILNSSKISF